MQSLSAGLLAWEHWETHSDPVIPGPRTANPPGVRPLFPAQPCQAPWRVGRAQWAGEELQPQVSGPGCQTLHPPMFIYMHAHMCTHAHTCTHPYTHTINFTLRAFYHGPSSTM